MKTTVNKARAEQGSILMVSLFMCFLFGYFLYSYLNSVQEQKAMVARSQGWNCALTLAEGGVDEALAQLNPGAPQPVIDRTGNGWGAASGGVYGPVSRTLTSGSYSVVLTADAYPIIYSTGYVTVPALSATLTRILRVGTTNAPLFSVAGGARSGIDLKGNNINSDSFNSCMASLSTNGRYDPNKTSTNGDLASIAGIVNVGNANVNGSVLLGPTANDNILANGTVTGGVSQDFNVEFEDVVLPQTSWLPQVPLALPSLINTVSFDYVFNISGDYTINNLNGSIYVASNTVVRLRLTGNASPPNIEIGGIGGSAGKLTIYMDGPSFSLSGNEIVDGGVASSLAYYGTTNNTQFNLTGNASWTGTIYAPEADIKMGGGGNAGYDVVGAIIGNTLTMNGHFNLHFDECLLGSGPSRGFVANSWREL
jgi:hypothetical protein